MRLFIADPGLQANRGHHANGCRYLLNAARARNVQTRVLAHADIETGLKAELDAEPFFKEYTYQFTDGDPYVGWLTSFHRVADATCDDLAGLEGYSSEDIFYFQGAQPAQLMAAIDWAASLPERKCPVVVVELGSDAGVKLTYDGPNVAVGIPNPQGWGGRPTLFRFAARYMAKLGSRPFFVVTYDATVSQVYAVLMQQPIGTVPFAVAAHGKIKSRRGCRPITIGVLGHQQLSKGYHFIPDVIEKTLKRHENIAFLLHNSDPDQEQSAGADEMRHTQAALRKMAKGNSKIILKEGVTDFPEWKRLLDATDVLLCPYDPARYATGHSGLIASALANGIPFIVPADTSMAKRMEEFGSPGIAFERYAADSVAHALDQMLSDFDMYADRALAAAQMWADTQGPENCVDLLLKVKADPKACFRNVREGLALASPSAQSVLAVESHRAGRNLAVKGSQQEALQKFDEALRLCPTFGEAWLSRGGVLQQMGRDFEAYEAYAQAMLLTPLYDAAIIKFNELAQKLGRATQLLTPWAEKPSPKLSARFAAMFGKHVEMPLENESKYGHSDEALLRQLLVGSSSDSEIALALGKKLKADGRWEEASSFLRYAQRFAPWDGEIEVLLKEVSAVRETKARAGA